MQEWDVVGVIAALLTLCAAVVAPMVKLAHAIARLTATMEQLEKSMERLTADNRGAHARIWDCTRAQDGRLNDHEARIRVIEET